MEGGNGSQLFGKFQGFWCLGEYIPSIISFQTHFQALDEDIVIATMPKVGTTWLKALVFSIVNRHRYTLSDTPLNLSNPHDLVPYFELFLYANGQVPDLTSTIPSPRLFATHIPYPSLAESIKQSNTKIVYVTRNPLDAIVSFWYHVRAKPESSDWPLEECFEMFCGGEEWFGPFWNHVLGYWKQSLEKPNKVLFLRYEDLKKNPVSEIGKIADFTGFPFSDEEEGGGVVQGIADFCSFSNLKDLPINKTGILGWANTNTMPTNAFFRKGEVGDHLNHLSPSQIQRFTKILQDKLSESGLSLTN
ncbi:hypothetical protein COLO4_04919 [Corchorus olitorius]|uniref:Sulfotransferase n=1 Tax=Corchorus olitorius TaxID=93759 RepID=A0A1R3KSD7_9ROSI|nr:hypothetical protein COLO4_04919 [Corchorus olitorius]